MGELRLRTIFQGMVQGVGFRYTTVHVAASFAVTGYVRNRADGTVELVAEGERTELEAFLESVCRRMGRYIDDRDASWEAATGEFDSFDVRFR